MLKMVGTSGQLSLGKKYAGKYFELDFGHFFSSMQS